jgi:4-amino-4-deoxy-L-arabinose transferase-like glycosyltransferase
MAFRADMGHLKPARAWLLRALEFRSPIQLMIAASIWLAALAWVRPLALPDEGRYTDIARWMAGSGDWLIPRMNGLPFIQKPPLYFWLEAAAIGTVGASPFAARLVSLASSVLICVSVFWLVRRFVDERSARWSLAALVFNPLYFGGAQYANFDMLIAGLVTATLALAVSATQSTSRARTLWLSAYATAGLAVLAKGLIGIVLPGMVFVGWAVVSRRLDWLVKALSLPGLLLFAIIALPWFILVERHYSGFINYFFVYHHFDRYLQSGFNNAHGVWFFPAVLLVGMLPWTVAPLFHWRSFLQASASSLRSLGFVWFAVILIFFSLPPSKLVGYIFPLLPAFAIIVGPWFATYRYRYATATLGGAICACAVFVAAYVIPTGPIGLAKKFKEQIAPTHDVVFVGQYLFDVAVILDRKTPIYVVDDWSRRAADLPDSIRRQFTEGREFDPMSAHALIGGQELKVMLAEGRRMWIWTRRADLIPQNSGLVPVASQGGYTVLRIRD